MPSSEPAGCTNQLQCSTSPLKNSAADRLRTGVLDSHPAENKVTAQQDVLNLLRCMLGSLQSGMQDYIDMTVAVSSTRMCIVVCLRACLTTSSSHTVVSRSIILSKTFVRILDPVCRA